MSQSPSIHGPGKNTPIKIFIDHLEETEFYGKIELIVQCGQVVRWEEKKMHLADDYIKKAS